MKRITLTLLCATALAAAPAPTVAPRETSGGGTGAVIRHDTDIDAVRTLVSALDAGKVGDRNDTIERLATIVIPESTDALLRTLRQNVDARRGYDRQTRCVAFADGVRAHLSIPPENQALSEALARHGAAAAAPTVRAALACEMARPQAERSASLTTALASALYDLTTEAAERWDGTAASPYRPTDLQQEFARVRFRPDLKPTDGLTAALELPATFKAKGMTLDGGMLGFKPVVLTLRLKNHTAEPIPVDLAAESFTLTCLADGGDRRELAMERLGQLTVLGVDGQPVPHTIPSGGVVAVSWRVERLAGSPLADLFGKAYFYARLGYAPADPATKQAWGGSAVSSDTVQRYSFPDE